MTSPRGDDAAWRRGSPGRKGGVFRAAHDIEQLRADSLNGHAAASHRLAVLHAMGLGVPHSWSGAMELLRRAADQGLAAAEAQISIIGPADDVAQRWLTPPAPQSISARPAILTIDGMISAEACDWIRSSADPLIQPALVYDPETGEGRSESVRTNGAAVLDLDRLDVLVALVRERIARAAGLPVAGLEWTQVLRYQVGETFDWHHDWLDPGLPGYSADLAARGQRIATCLIYLNDDFEGGETAFRTGDLRHRGRKGDALLWANTLPQGGIDPETLHAGLPPTAGEKWVLSQWLRGRAPR